jgi:hypothetical protein
VGVRRGKRKRKEKKKRNGQKKRKRKKRRRKEKINYLFFRNCNLQFILTVLLLNNKNKM